MFCGNRYKNVRPLYKSIFGNSDDESLTRIHALIDQEGYWKDLIVEQGLGMEELAA